jgi:prolipoprotein diacylglyceryltransferase
VIGGRLVWVITHAEYYMRQPLQAVVILDGGLHAVGLALGVIYWVWRHSRSDGEPSWILTADLVAVSVLTTFLFERVGCALTTCGTGPASELPGAILRGDEWHTPMALVQVVALAFALIVSAERLPVRGAAFFTMLAALVLVEAVAFSVGRPAVEGVAALGVVAAIYAVVSRYTMAATRQSAGGRVGHGRREMSQPTHGSADHGRL